VNIQKANLILDKIVVTFPNAHCELNYNSGFELLVAVVLSAQCTDRRVNVVTKELFGIANTADKMLELGQERLEKIIYPCGFYNQKAQTILQASSRIKLEHGGNVPNDFDFLTSIKGIGRKTANVVLSELFNGGGIAVDTHVFRVAKRLGLAAGNTPEKVEKELTVLYGDRTKAAHQSLVFFGRYLCRAIKPLCTECPVKENCLFQIMQKSN